MTKTNAPENDSEDADDWGSQWDDFGTLPSTILPDFNVAFAEFIIGQAVVSASFHKMIRQEGGIHSFACFCKVFASPFPRILDMFGGKIATTYQMELVQCIALACFLALAEHDIVSTDGNPEYSDFHIEDWLDYLSIHGRRLLNEFRQEITTRIAYEAQSKSEYVDAQRHSSRAGSSGASSTTPSVNTPSTPKTAQSLSFGIPPTTGGISNVTTPSDFMQRVKANTTAANSQ
jgi:hypothetical protein